MTSFKALYYPNICVEGIRKTITDSSPRFEPGMSQIRSRRGQCELEFPLLFGAHLNAYMEVWKEQVST
jgi:hypothetical protein